MRGVRCLGQGAMLVVPQMNKQYRVMKTLLVDDHALFRAGLRLLLGTLNRELQTFEVATVYEALALAALHPDLSLCLLDLALKGENGINAIQRLKRAAPNVAIVVVSASEENSTIYACIEAGAMSFISKSSSPEVLTDALRRVLAGEVYLPEQMHGGHHSLGSPKVLLSPRQCEVMRGLSRGLPTKLIARELGLSEHTVREYIAAIYKHLDVHNRTEAVIKAASLGMPR
jgi:two-component system, NarL family, nitrate/nitrite response regulator NarL